MSQPEQQQQPPGTERQMDPVPDHGEESYRGSGRLAGKAAVITGADSGIGKAVAIAFAREGADVLISYLSEHDDAKDTRRWVEDAGRRAVLVPGDLADPACCRAVIARAVEEFGRVDILVSNAAFQMTHDSLGEISDEEWDHTLAVNLSAMFHLCKAAIPSRCYEAGPLGRGACMQMLRALARPMLASIFVVQGYDTFREPGRVAPLAEPVVRPLAERVPAVPACTEQAVRINGAVQMVAGSLLALSRWPRLSALAIAATLVPTTIAGHRFWEAADDVTAAQQRIHFLKNLTMFGGLLIAAADTAGDPSLAWRTRHAARSARNQASLAIRTAKVSGKAGAKTGKLTSRVAR